MADGRMTFGKWQKVAVVLPNMVSMCCSPCLLDPNLSLTQPFLGTLLRPN